MHCIYCTEEGRETVLIQNPYRESWLHCPVHEPEWVKWIMEQRRIAFFHTFKPITQGRPSTHSRYMDAEPV